METVGVIIPTFGDLELWTPLAQRAFQSAGPQADRVVHYHADTLQEARNVWAEIIKTDWLIFLDADDELEPGYVDAMLKASGDIRRPSTRGVYEDGTIEDPPSMIPRRDLRISNYIVIGAMCRRDLFLQVGGFDDYPVLEDWALWRKMVRIGASVVDVPEAVYRIHVRPESRNKNDIKIYNRIKREVLL